MIAVLNHLFNKPEDKEKSKPDTKIADLTQLCRDIKIMLVDMSKKMY